MSLCSDECVVWGEGNTYICALFLLSYGSLLFQFSHQSFFLFFFFFNSCRGGHRFQHVHFFLYVPKKMRETLHK